MTIASDSSGWYRLERAIDPAVIEQLKQLAPIEKLSAAKLPLVTVKLARRLAGLRVQHLWLGSEVTRRAMRHIIQLPSLKALDVLRLHGPGKLGGFRQAMTLEIFRANLGMTEADILEVAACVSLRELGAQGAEISPRALDAILALPNLVSLDLEATRFNDSMARKLSRSRTIETLDLGATPLTGIGLTHLAEMPQLRALDLWATRIADADLRLLLEIPNLEYVSLGNYHSFPSLDEEKVCNLILASPSLKRVWLDGIRLNAAQKAALETKLESLRVTVFDDDS